MSDPLIQSKHVLNELQRETSILSKSACPRQNRERNISRGLDDVPPPLVNQSSIVAFNSPVMLGAVTAVIVGVILQTIKPGFVLKSQEGPAEAQEVDLIRLTACAGMSGLLLGLGLQLRN